MITVSGLTKRYGRTVVLDDLDFSVPQGEIAAVLGPSGAGKSTLARCINLLERPTAGSVEVDGQELTRLRQGKLRVARQAIGTVFQSANLLSRLTVAENVALPLDTLDLTDAERHRRVRDLLERVGLLDRARHYPAQLSGGQRQRVGIARGLALRPSVLLADEATSGLDPVATSSILKLITELRDEFGLTVVLITHEMDVVRATADSVALLDHGRIVEHGTVRDILRGTDSALSRALLPVPSGPDLGDARVWNLRYGPEVVHGNWVADVGRRLGTDLTLRSALIEQVGGTTVGRASVGLDRSISRSVVVAAFAASGIVVEEADVAAVADGAARDLAAVENAA